MSSTFQKILLSSCLVASCIIFSGCQRDYGRPGTYLTPAFIPTATPAKTGYQPSTESPTKTAPAVTPYTSTKYNFSLKLPKDWTTTEDNSLPGLYFQTPDDVKNWELNQKNCANPDTHNLCLYQLLPGYIVFSDKPETDKVIAPGSTESKITINKLSFTRYISSGITQWTHFVYTTGKKTYDFKTLFGKASEDQLIEILSSLQIK